MKSGSVSGRATYLQGDGKNHGVRVGDEKPKIWSLADTAACKTPPPAPAPPPPPPPVPSTWSTVDCSVPLSAYGTMNNQGLVHGYSPGGPPNYHSGFSTTGTGGGGGNMYASVGTFPTLPLSDTPPQTPPGASVPSYYGAQSLLATVNSSRSSTGSGSSEEERVRQSSGLANFQSTRSSPPTAFRPVYKR